MCALVNVNQTLDDHYDSSNINHPRAFCSCTMATTAMTIAWTCWPLGPLRPLAIRWATFIRAARFNFIIATGASGQVSGFIGDMAGAVTNAATVARFRAWRPVGPWRPMTQAVEWTTELYFVVVARATRLVNVDTAQAHCRPGLRHFNVLLGWDWVVIGKGDFFKWFRKCASRYVAWHDLINADLSVGVADWRDNICSHRTTSFECNWPFANASWL